MVVAGAPRRVSGGGSRVEEEEEEEELSRNSATKGCHKRLSQKAVTKHSHNRQYFQLRLLHSASGIWG
jgi:hypothetical protein